MGITQANAGSGWGAGLEALRARLPPPSECEWPDPVYRQSAGGGLVFQAFTHSYVMYILTLALLIAALRLCSRLLTPPKREAATRKHKPLRPQPAALQGGDEGTSHLQGGHRRAQTCGRVVPRPRVQPGPLVGFQPTRRGKRGNKAASSPAAETELPGAQEAPDAREVHGESGDAELLAPPVDVLTQHVLAQDGGAVGCARSSSKGPHVDDSAVPVWAWQGTAIIDDEEIIFSDSQSEASSLIGRSATPKQQRELQIV